MFYKEDNKIRLTYTNIKDQYLRNIGKAGSTDTTIVSDFNLNLGQRYQMVLAYMADYMTQMTKTASTVAAQQNYHYPVGVRSIESATINLGSYTQPLDVLTSQHNWDFLNAIQVQASAIPQFILPQRDQFGIWPTPQAVYTITLNYHLRDRNMMVADYTTGTCTVTNNSQTVTGSGTTWTAAMVGRWFVVSSTTAPGEGYWYRIIDVAGNTSLTLETSWEGTTGAGVSYVIGQTPEIPEEGHISLVDGVTADFYAGLMADITKATWFNSRFWTGDGNNPSRKIGDQSVKGGVIGMINKYGDRNNEKIISRKPRLSPLIYQIWGTRLS